MRETSSRTITLTNLEMVQTFCKFHRDLLFIEFLNFNLIFSQTEIIRNFAVTILKLYLNEVV